MYYKINTNVSGNFIGTLSELDTMHSKIKYFFTLLSILNVVVCFSQHYKVPIYGIGVWRKELYNNKKFSYDSIIFNIYRDPENSLYIPEDSNNLKNLIIDLDSIAVISPDSIYRINFYATNRGDGFPSVLLFPGYINTFNLQGLVFNDIEFRTTVKNIIISYPTVIRNLLVLNSNVDNMTLEKVYCFDANFLGTTFNKKIVIKNSTFHSTPLFESTTFPDTIILCNIDLRRIDKIIDLSKTTVNKSKPKPVIVLENIDFTKFKFPLYSIQFVIGENQLYGEKVILYRNRPSDCILPVNLSSDSFAR